jgi:hypothetical protein
MYRFATNSPIDVDELRERFRRITDEQLLAFGKAARYMCTPKANLGQPPREPFVIQLREARAEWRRRHNTISACETESSAQLLTF